MFTIAERPERRSKIYYYHHHHQRQQQQLSEEERSISSDDDDDHQPPTIFQHNKNRTFDRNRPRERYIVDTGSSRWWERRYCFANRFGCIGKCTGSSSASARNSCYRRLIGRPIYTVWQWLGLVCCVTRQVGTTNCPMSGLFRCYRDTNYKEAKSSGARNLYIRMRCRPLWPLDKPSSSYTEMRKTIIRKWKKRLRQSTKAS